MDYRRRSSRILLFFAPNNQNDRVEVLNLITFFVQLWNCSNCVLLGDFSSIFKSVEHWGINGYGLASENSSTSLKF